MEYKCGSCREVSALSPKSKFCPICGSSSLILVVKEQAEPHQKETVGVHKTATLGVDLGTKSEKPTIVKHEFSSEEFDTTKEEEDRPRRRR